ncbi:MAG TPA: c-type cytochrome [Candidatus Limnocylindrales bacterium]|jgi:ubiquinol-cytochrome c reductase cytochrome c subunit
MVSGRARRPSHRKPGGLIRAAGGLAALVAIIGLGAILAAPLAFGQAPPAGDAGASNTVSQGSAAAAAMYLHSCASCHGDQGAGTLYGPNIQDAGAALVDFVLRTGRMPLSAPGQQMQRGQPAFDDADRAALVGYVAAFGQGPGIPDVQIEGADVANGRSLYVANCAACHGPAGGGGSVGGGFVAPGLGQADPQTVGEAVITGPGPMPRFSFTPDQLRDLAAYAVSLRNSPHPGGVTGPTLGPVTEGFIAGLGLLALLVVARFIGVRQARHRAER